MFKRFLAICGASMLFLHCAGRRPVDLGITDGKLAACPDSPNCVSSRSADEEHGIGPLAWEASPSEAVAKLKEIILSMERTTIITETDSYLHAEFKSATWGYVDDVEFQIDGESKVIHVRSASRLGYGDFGVNRKRIEAIRAKLEEN
jgi:uncharacterized protein (DUF1499 family)